MLSVMFDLDSVPDRAPESPPVSPRRPRRARKPALSTGAKNPGEIGLFPDWGRLPDADGGRSDAAFHAGAGLALFDRLLRAGEDGAEPAYAGALRRRLALRAAASCARLARLREDESALRDAEHLAPPHAPPSPAGRLHRLFRRFGEQPVRLDRATLAVAAELLLLRLDEPALVRLVEALQRRASKPRTPLLAVVEASRAAMSAVTNSAPVDADIVAFWLADATLAQELGWASPVPLFATAIHHPALRIGPNGRRSRPGDPEWGEANARALALACHDAYALGADLARRADRLQQAAPKLRAKGAARVVAMLLEDDCVTPARAAKESGLSDRAARRLFDRLIELGTVRELSGRANFRLYGL